MHINYFRSKTFWGGVLTAFGYLTQPNVLAVLPRSVSGIVTGIGIILTAVGIRSAVGKAAAGVVQLNLFSVLLAVLLATPMVYVARGTAEWTITSPNNVWSFHGATAGVRAEDGAWYPDAEDLLAGDSLKVVVGWTHPTDTAGNEDSTVFRLTVSKPMRWYNRDSVIVAASVAQRRRYFPGAITDSFKLAKPVIGDSATFALTNFIQCRRGDCSIPGGSAGAYKTTWAPIPSAPSLKTSVF